TSQPLSLRRHELPCQRADIIAAVAVLRKGQRLAASFQVPYPRTHREDVDLPSRVVDVVLASYVESDGGQDVGQRGSVCGLTSMPDVQRPRRVGRYELEQHPLSPAKAAVALHAAVALGPLVDGGQLAPIGGGRQEEVDEAGAGDLRARHERAGRQGGNDLLRQLPRLAAGRLREAHGGVGCKITVLRIAGALDRERARRRRPGQRAADERIDCAREELLDFLLQGGEGPGWINRESYLIESKQLSGPQNRRERF